MTETKDAGFKKLLEERAAAIDAMLQAYWPAREDAYRTVTEAMRYSLLAGGKRLRPILMQETYRLFGGSDARLIEPFMAAIEMIHTYSLVHDDLPAMDNDEYRRGRRTTWAVYGEAMGILAGDALLNAAYETAVSVLEICESPEEYRRVGRALQTLGRQAGVWGMIGGQAADIEAEKQAEPLSDSQLAFIHLHKTGALIRAAMSAGALLAGASKEQEEAVCKCALDIGMAFQIQDDILDVVGNSEELGKPVGSDAANGKQTFVTLYGLERSKAEVERLSGEALEILGELPGDHAFLEGLVRYLIDRRN